MKLEEVRAAYYEATGKTSEIVRNLGFAGIALVWIFKTGADGNQTIPGNLLLPAILIVIGLTLDLCQYVARSVIWGLYNRIKEGRGVTDEQQFEAPGYINWLPLFFFWSKIICIIVAYILLIAFLRSRFV